MKAARGKTPAVKQPSGRDRPGQPSPPLRPDQAAGVESRSALAEGPGGPPRQPAALRGAQWAIELGVIFVLCEGLLRRLLPGQSMYVLGFKFLYFPVVYAVLFTRFRPVARMRWLPSGAALFLGWGTLITLANMWQYVVPHSAWWHPAEALLGLAVDLFFVPLAFFGAMLYPTFQDRRRFFLHMTALAGVLGVLAICQSTLPATHWLNVGINLEDAGIMDRGSVRVASSFQFCNVFGLYAAFGLLAATASIYFARNMLEAAFALGCGVLLYVGVLESGSRMGGLGSLLVLAIAVLPSGLSFKRLRIAVVGALLVGVAVFIISHLTSSRPEDPDLPRSQTAEDIVERTTDVYLGSTLWRAADLSYGVGFRLGPLDDGRVRLRAGPHRRNAPCAGWRARNRGRILHSVCGDGVRRLRAVPVHAAGNVLARVDGPDALSLARPRGGRLDRARQSPLLPVGGLRVGDPMVAGDGHHASGDPACQAGAARGGSLDSGCAPGCDPGCEVSPNRRPRADYRRDFIFGRDVGRLVASPDELRRRFSPHRLRREKGALPCATALPWSIFNVAATWVSVSSAYSRTSAGLCPHISIAAFMPAASSARDSAIFWGT